jgi:hypothetical protein
MLSACAENCRSTVLRQMHFHCCALCYSLIKAQGLRALLCTALVKYSRAAGTGSANCWLHV